MAAGALHIHVYVWVPVSGADIYSSYKMSILYHDYGYIQCVFYSKLSFFHIPNSYRHVWRNIIVNQVAKISVHVSNHYITSNHFRLVGITTHPKRHIFIFICRKREKINSGVNISFKRVFLPITLTTDDINQSQFFFFTYPLVQQAQLWSDLQTLPMISAALCGVGHSWAYCFRGAGGW